MNRSATLPTQAALQAALQRLLQPLVRLALAHGLQHGALDELLRTLLVQEARRMLDTGRRHGLISRVSTATGLTRREAGRLLDSDPAQLQVPQSHAREVFTRWLSEPRYQHAGAPLTLPRSGAAPSFEALARSVTQDVHPRSLLDELCRLELVALDAAEDTVTLQRTTFVPRTDAAQMLTLLADNASDHLNAAVANVLGHGNVHFEQALYADELSPESVQALRPLIADEWSHLFQHMAPALAQRLDSDREHGRRQDQRVRVGFYSYTEAMHVPDAACGAATGNTAGDQTA